MIIGVQCNIINGLYKFFIKFEMNLRYFVIKFVWECYEFCFSGETNTTTTTFTSLFYSRQLYLHQVVVGKSIKFVEINSSHFILWKSVGSSKVASAPTLVSIVFQFALSFSFHQVRWQGA